MKIIHDAEFVLKRAWSIRFAIVAGLFSAAEVIVPLYESAMPRGLFASLSGLTTAAALISRFIAQDHGTN